MRIRLEDLCKRSPLILCIFVVVGGTIYFNSLENSFQYDDQISITDNRNIRILNNIPYFFIKAKMLFADPYIKGGHYRPLTVTSYAINYALSGLNPVGYHLVNLAFHVGSAFVIFLIVKAMLGSREQGVGSRKESRIQNSESRSKRQDGAAQFIGQRGKIEEDPDKLDAYKVDGLFAAFVAGLIFLVHPFNSEVVNYITARFSVMSGFFYLLGFYWWVKYRSQNSEVRIQKSEFRSQKKSYFLPLTSYFYLGSLLAFMAGMLSKEVVITLPIVLWLYDRYGFNTVRSQESGVRSQKNLLPAACSKDRPEGLSLRLPATYLNWRTCLPYIPFILAVVLPYFVIRAFSSGGLLPNFHRDIGTQIFTELPVLIKHWQMFLLPTLLTPFHHVDIHKTFWSFPVIFSIALLIVYIAIALLLFLRYSHIWRVVSFFMFWFFIVLLPTTIIPLNTIFQENRGYLAIVSFTVFGGVVIGEMSRTKVRGVAVILLVMLIALYSWTVFQRNKVWRDEVTLWSDAVKKTPLSPEAYTALGIAYRRADRYTQAIEASLKALKLGGQNNFFVHDNIGRIYMAQEKWELAAQEFERAIIEYPYKAESHNDLGAVYYRMGKLDKVEKEYKEAIRLDPDFYKPYFNLGVLYTKQGRVEGAVRAYQKALSLDSGHLRSKLHLGILLEEMGRREEAAKYYSQVVREARQGEGELLREAYRRLGTYTLDE